MSALHSTHSLALEDKFNHFEAEMMPKPVFVYLYAAAQGSGRHLSSARGQGGGTLLNPSTQSFFLVRQLSLKELKGTDLSARLYFILVK